jgi:DNA-binding Lrp family transcriptional regulator
MKVSQEEYDLLTELANDYTIPNYDPDRHVLLSDAADLWGISERGAWNRLEKLVKDGAWGVETVLHEGRQKNGYYKIAPQ